MVYTGVGIRAGTMSGPSPASRTGASGSGRFLGQPVGGNRQHRRLECSINGLCNNMCDALSCCGKQRQYNNDPGEHRWARTPATMSSLLAINKPQSMM